MSKLVEIWFSSIWVVTQGRGCLTEIGVVSRKYESWKFMIRTSRNITNYWNRSNSLEMRSKNLNIRKSNYFFSFELFKQIRSPNVWQWAHTLWIWSTYEYYNFTDGELQTPSRNDSMSTSVFWWECVFVWTFHLNQHHSSRTDSEQEERTQNRRVVLQDEIRYSLTVFCYALQWLWSLSG